MIDSQANRQGNDYVILGPHVTWPGPSPPASLTIDQIDGTRAVGRETYDYMSRGWNLRDGTYKGTVKLEDDTE
eukprot:5506654-Ditylum_brightwellii.AAC.1